MGCRIFKSAVMSRTPQTFCLRDRITKLKARSSHGIRAWRSGHFDGYGSRHDHDDGYRSNPSDALFQNHGGKDCAEEDGGLAQRGHERNRHNNNRVFRMFLIFAGSLRSRLHSAQASMESGNTGFAVTLSIEGWVTRLSIFHRYLPTCVMYPEYLLPYCRSKNLSSCRI
jgi:hypothetical protein